MKAINSSVRPAYFSFDLDLARHAGATSQEKKLNHRTERARLKASLNKEIHQANAEKIVQKHIEDVMTADAAYLDLMTRVNSIASATPHAVKSAKSRNRKASKSRATPAFTVSHEPRHDVWFESMGEKMLLASCALA